MATIGEKLRDARVAKQVDIREAAAATRIKAVQLESLEEDDYSKIPAPAYAKGFIRLYARFLGLDPQPLVDQYIEEHLAPPKEEEEEPLVQQPVKPAPAPAPAAQSTREPEPIVPAPEAVAPVQEAVPIEESAVEASVVETPAEETPQTPPRTVSVAEPNSTQGVEAIEVARPRPTLDQRATISTSEKDFEKKGLPILPVLGVLAAILLIVFGFSSLRGCGDKGGDFSDMLLVDDPLIAEPPDPYFEQP